MFYIFSTFFSVFQNAVKHGLLCLIYYYKFLSVKLLISCTWYVLCLSAGMRKILTLVTHILFSGLNNQSHLKLTTVNY